MDRYLHCDVETPPLLRALATIEGRTMKRVLDTALAFYAVSSCSAERLHAAGVNVGTLKLRAWEWEKRIP